VLQCSIMRENIHCENKTRVSWLNKNQDYSAAFDYNPRTLPMGTYSKEEHTPVTYHIPGYGGYVPQGKFTFGTTYGNVTDGAYENQQDYNQTLTQEEQAQPPRGQPRLPQISRSSGKMRGAAFHCPGYLGHVPGKNGMIAKTYTQITRECLQQRQAQANERSRQVAALSGSRTGVILSGSRTGKRSIRRKVRRR